MTVSSLQPPTFSYDGQNLQLSYAGQTAASPVQNTPNGVSGAAYVNDGQGDSAAVKFSVNSFGQTNFTEAVGNQGSDTLTTVQANTKGTVVTQTIFNELTGAVTTIKIQSDGNGQYSYTETDDSQNGISSYSSDGQPASGQYANTNALIKDLFS